MSAINPYTVSYWLKAIYEAEPGSVNPAYENASLSEEISGASDTGEDDILSCILTVTVAVHIACKE